MARTIMSTAFRNSPSSAMTSSAWQEAREQLQTAKMADDL